MRPRARRTLTVTLILTLAVTAVAFAGPLRGRIYTGAVPASGKSNRRHLTVPLHAGGSIILKVSPSGRTVTVSFSSPYPVLYCNTAKALRVQKTTAAKISRAGDFKASVSQRFNPGPGLPPIVQVIYGHFSGASVSGTIQTVQSECGGVSYFSGRAH